ncbi:proton-conducting transporter membrane subunit [Pseudomonas aeruginosa]
MIGVFLAIDLFLFFFFWEMMLVPMYFLIALWGHSSDDGKRPASTPPPSSSSSPRPSGLVMLIAILGLAFVHFQCHRRDGPSTTKILLKTQLTPHGVEYMLMLGFFIAFAVKMPVVPLHGWLPDAHAQAPTAGSVDLAGILLKTAAYGLLRFCAAAVPRTPPPNSRRSPCGWAYRYLLRRVDGLRPDRY